MYSLQISLDKETTESITSILLRYKPTKRVDYNLKVERLFLLKKKEVPPPSPQFQ